MCSARDEPCFLNSWHNVGFLFFGGVFFRSFYLNAPDSTKQEKHMNSHSLFSISLLLPSN